MAWAGSSREGLPDRCAFRKCMCYRTSLPSWKGPFMRIAVSAMEPNLDSEINPRFGRSQYFILIDPETMEYESLTNPDAEIASGAGISTAQFVHNKGASVVITGTIGPKAHQALAAAGVRMLTGVSGTVRDAVSSFKAGEQLFEISSERNADAGAGRGMGRGMGMGSGGGRGGGGGRGMGRGMGCGGGRGKGMGRGR